MSVALVPDVARTEGRIGLDAVAAIFASVLDGPVGLDDDFFEVGGTSMAAISLILEIEKRTGRELSIGALYNAPTARLMAAMLAGEEEDDGSSIILLREGPAGPSLFLVHGVGGTAIELRELARAIDLPIRVHGIQAVGLDGSAPNTTIAAMAASYVRDVLTLQPAGPYLLAGFSVGGLVAFEMARLLRGLGNDVSFLGLIDIFPAYRRSWRWFAEGVVRTARSSRDVRTREMAKLRVLLAARVRAVLRRPEPPVYPVLPAAVQRVREAGYAAVRAYRPSPMSCDLTFFQATGRVELFPPAPQRVWRPLVRTLTVEPVPGEHLALVMENAGLLAAALERRLRAVLATA